MPDNLFLYIGIYFTVIGIWAAGLVLYDKRAARSGSWRIKERTLLIVSAIGGSVVMLLTMRAARHKTQHAKFMVGIPIIIILQISVAFIICWKL